MARRHSESKGTRGPGTAREGTEGLRRRGEKGRLFALCDDLGDLSYPKAAEIIQKLLRLDPSDMQQGDRSGTEGLHLESRVPLHQGDMAVSIHVRGITERGRRDRRDCAWTCQQQAEEARHFGPGPDSAARYPSCRQEELALSRDNSNSGRRAVSRSPRRGSDPSQGTGCGSDPSQGTCRG